MLPVGRVEPVTIMTTLRRAIADVRAWMPGRRIDQLADEWATCSKALDWSTLQLDRIDEISVATDELDVVFDSARMLMDRLNAFADAQEALRRD